ncbi:hypothetical protein ACFX2I_014802 [Malus domestica]
MKAAECSVVGGQRAYMRKLSAEGERGKNAALWQRGQRGEVEDTGRAVWWGEYGTAKKKRGRSCLWAARRERRRRRKTGGD